MQLTVLAIDTSTERAGLAVMHHGDVWVESWDAGRTQTTSLLPAIDALLGKAGLTPDEMDAVVVATGPGTFTGLRVGVSIAKGIVLARNIPLIGIPTLDIVVAGEPSLDDLVAVLPAGRGRVVWQRFGSNADESPRNTTLDELITSLATMPGTLVAGELSEQQRERVSTAHARTIWSHRDPAVLLRLGKERLDRGDVDDPVTLEPVYVHGVTVQAGPVEDRLRRPARG